MTRATANAAALTIERDLPVLEALAADPSLSHRQVASRTGLSTARAHFVLRRLMEKGLVKVKSAAHSKHKFRYLYVLTPHGIEAKARLTYLFMHRMAEQHRAMVEQVERRLDLAIDEAKKDRAEAPRPAGQSAATLGEATAALKRANGHPPVEEPVPLKKVKLWIAGSGPLAEVVRDVANLRPDVSIVEEMTESELGIVADPELERPAGGPARWVHLA